MKNIKRKTTMLLLAFCILSVMLVTPMQTDSTSIDEGFFSLSVEARLVNGEMIIESHFDGPDHLTASFAADFTPNEEFVLSDGSDYDNDAPPPGASGGFAVSVTGYWKTGEDFYWKEAHNSYFYLNAYHSYQNLVVEHNSDEYLNTLYTTGTSYYWEDVTQYAQTRMDLDVYYLVVFFVGHVSLDCLVNPTQH
ncbi:MAG: hypothetical protein E4H14_00430 [Candidatus Thorarchaeota archaeon]|nr:MAG: hypothetical protein E4H14_00430 [Candidatus Thorarchaeota archaeon]